jgi:hypothetical protein
MNPPHTPFAPFVSFIPYPLWEENPKGCSDTVHLQRPPQLAPVASHTPDDGLEVVDPVLKLAPHQPCAGADKQLRFIKRLWTETGHLFHFRQQCTSPFIQPVVVEREWCGVAIVNRMDGMTGRDGIRFVCHAMKKSIL